jgi:hypothetical protein
MIVNRLDPSRSVSRSANCFITVAEMGLPYSKSVTPAIEMFSLSNRVELDDVQYQRPHQLVRKKHVFDMPARPDSRWRRSRRWERSSPLLDCCPARAVWIERTEVLQKRR